jgi:hypothetical protein
MQLGIANPGNHKQNILGDHAWGQSGESSLYPVFPPTQFVADPQWVQPTTRSAQMKLVQKKIISTWQFLTILIIGLALAGCSIKLVADYDSTTFEEVISVGKKVDRFYGDLLETPVNERQYQKFTEKYVEIETDLRSLGTRNRARALNNESTQISDIILALWVKYKTNHAANNGYGNGIAKLDRDRFTRLFISAANAETAKKLDAGDKDPAQASK